MRRMAAKDDQAESPKDGQWQKNERNKHIYNTELIQQVIPDSTVVKFRRSGSSSVGLPSNTLLPSWATNAWAVGASADDVSTLFTLGRTVWIVGSITDALSPGMVKTC
jgi:Zn-dependent M28 family amino/carboxypeptidase